MSEALHRAREELADELANGDEEIRRLAIEQLAGELSDSEIRRLLDALGDTSWRVRKAAVARLVASARRPGVIDGLIAGLADADNSGRRNSALEALIGSGFAVVPAVIAALATPDADVRKQLVDVIAGVGDPEAVGATLCVLSDVDPNVAAAAADALGVLGGEQATSALVDVATTEGGEPLLRSSALRALMRLEASVPGEQLSSAVSDAVLRPAAFGVMGHGDDAYSLDQLFKGLELRARSSREASVEALLSRVANAGMAEAVQISARIEATAAASDDLVAWAIEMLRDADLCRVLRLVQFLGLCRDPRAVIPILSAAADAAATEVAQATLVSLGDLADAEIDRSWPGLSHSARIEACRAMGLLRGATSASRLIAVLSEADSELRCEAARALALRRYAQALPMLIDRLSRVAVEGDDDERAAIADSISAISSAPGHGATRLADEVVAALSALLDGGAEPLRHAVAGVLVGLSASCDKGLLGRLLKDESPRVRRGAVEALVASESDVSMEGLRLALADESSSVRIAAVRALGRAGAALAGNDLLRVIDDADPGVRAAAVQALVKTSAADGEESLRASLVARVAELSSDDADVVISLIEALEREGGADVAQVAAALLVRQEPEVLEAAIRCSATHAGRDGLELLVPLVSHESWVVRASAIEALGSRRFAPGAPAVMRQLENEQDPYVREAIQRALARFEG